MENNRPNFLNAFKAYEALTKAQDAFNSISCEYKAARDAYKRSRSKKNVECYIKAEARWNAAFDEIQALHKACDEAEALDDKIALEKIKAEDEYRQPNLF